MSAEDPRMKRSPDELEEQQVQRPWGRNRLGASSPSKVGAGGDHGGQVGSRHRSPISKMRHTLFVLLTSEPGVRSILGELR